MTTNARNSGNGGSKTKSWVDAELEDSFDEELEMEIDDARVGEEVRKITALAPETAIDRRVYFRELLRLQAELVKLQDWVIHTKQKLVVIFEGRDAAGKGGVIKRITQRLNPRGARVVALPAPTEREQSQWYFQRTFRTCLPAAKSCCSIAHGTTAPASSASWASRHPIRSSSSSTTSPNSNECWCARASR